VAAERSTARSGNRPLASFLMTAAAAAAVLGLNSAWAKPRLSELVRAAVEVTTTRISGFDRFDSSRERFGKLVWRGGLILSAPGPAFGGFSGLALTADGSGVVAVSDGGGWLTGTLSLDEEHRPAAVTGVTMGPITGLEGKPLKRERDRDAEAVTVLPGGDEVLIAFEQNQRVSRHPLSKDGIGAATALLPMPKAVRQLRSNKSLESVTVLAAGPGKGSSVIFAERRQDSAGLQIGWLIPNGKAKPTDLRLARTGAFDLTDLAALPDGGMVVLWRSFSWDDGIRMRLERVGPEQLDKAIASGEPMRGELLFEADQRYEIDNMEGVAVSRGADGETELTLISDDNFSWLQRTVLLRFVLTGETVAAR
jgi:hypothetical protein